jgi:hypothetical protein
MVRLLITSCKFSSFESLPGTLLIFWDSIIPQEHSWGRLGITDPAFHILINAIRVSNHFLDIVFAFGVKSSEDERVVYGPRCCTERKNCPGEQHG